MRLGFLILLVFVWAGAAGAGAREMTLEGLEALAENTTSDSVRLSVNDGKGGALRIGDKVVYRFESDRAGFLTAIHVDTHGSATLLYPRADADSGRIGADRAILFPGPIDAFDLEVEPPVGRDVIFAFVTDAPIRRSELGIEGDDLVVAFEPQQAPPFVERLRDLLASRDTGHYRSAKLTQQIDGRGVVQYRSLDIVKFFGERTRSIARPKLDLQVQFQSNSAELDEQARRNIDEFAVALDHPKLRSMRFAVAGHTDDRGSESHNMGLSQRRASSVQKYLVESGGVDPARLEVQAHGEGLPLMDEDSGYARSMNRRVEFTPIR